MTHPLDSRDFVLRNDPKDMYGLTVAFPDQCRKAHEIASGVDISFGPWQPRNALLTGLGGSAVGGDFVRALMESEGEIPFQVNRDYTLPAFVDENTLVFATSYSGNTEETLSAYADAKKRGAQIVCVTSGGRLSELATENGDSLIVIPGGQPPRTALGFMLVPVVVACEKLGLISGQAHTETYALLEQCAKDWGVEVPLGQNPTKQLGESLFGKVSVLYGLGTWQGLVANRWKGQINENSKNMTFANTFPELNHNEILGWVRCETQNVKGWECVILESGDESAKMKTRASVTRELIQAKTGLHTVRSRGESLYEKMLSLVYFGDFVSLYLAALVDVDPEDIGSINHLKSALAEVD